MLADTQLSCIGGLNNEFIYSGRLDNQMSAYCAIQVKFYNKKKFLFFSILRVLSIHLMTMKRLIIFEEIIFILIIYLWFFKNFRLVRKVYKGLWVNLLNIHYVDWHVMNMNVQFQIHFLFQLIWLVCKWTKRKLNVFCF